MHELLQKRLEAARHWAIQAGELIMRFFRSQELQVQRKSDASPVTQADQEAERLLRQRIQEYFPEDSIVGEEWGETPGQGPFCWVLDPIDGTKSFVHGVPLFGTLIGLMENQQPVAGVIHIPALGETAWGGPQLGCWYEHPAAKPCETSLRPCPSLDQATVLTSELEGFAATGHLPCLLRLAQTAEVMRTWGDCYGYLMLVSGRADVMVDPRMHLWDAVAVMAVVQGAGGTFTCWQGRQRPDGGNGVASSPELLPQVLALLEPQEA